MSTTHENFTFACPYCGQHLQAEPDMTGMGLDCPTCGQKIIVPAQCKRPNAPNPAKVEAVSSVTEGVGNGDNASSGMADGGKPKSVKVKAVNFVKDKVEQIKAINGGAINGKVIRDRMTDAIGIEKLQGFSFSELFAQVFTKHSQKEVEESFAIGTEDSTPGIMEVDASWPKPWLFVRMMAASLLFFGLFWAGWNEYHNTNLLPGLMMIGSFAVPVSSLVLFIELNARKNISLYVVMRLVFLGGILSLLISLVLFDYLDKGWIGASIAGPIEETGKVLAMVAVARAAQYRYKLNGLLIGAAVGVGFAAFESAGYALSYFLDDFIKGTISFIVEYRPQDLDIAQFAGTMEGFPTMLNIIVVRGILSPMGHIVWSAIAGCALWRVIQGRPFSWKMLLDKNFLRLFAVPVALHMIWNSPIRLPFYGKYLIVGAIGWFIALSLVQEGLNEIRKEQQDIRDNQGNECNRIGPDTTSALSN